MRLAAATASSAVATLAVQLVALTSLAPLEYGLFSILYLAGAFALSVQLSVVSEAWVRAGVSGSSSDWRSYAGATGYLGLAGAVIAASIALFFPQLAESWWLAALAVWASVYRYGARFYSARIADWPGVLRGDIAGMVLAVTGSVVMLAVGGGLFAVMVVWALTSVSGAVASRFARPTGPGVLVGWIRDRRKSVKLLLADSLIMDLSSIGTPYLLAPILGLADFGIYRGVSNVSAPVRLVLNPLRPQISLMAHSRLARWSTIAALAAASVAVGGAAAAALLVLRHYYPYLGTLTELAQFAVPTGVFVTANMFGHSYYLVARNHASRRGLWRGRLVQTTLTVVLPIAAAVVYGLPSAIWAYAVATLLSAVHWCGVARGTTIDRDEPFAAPARGHD